VGVQYLRAMAALQVVLFHASLAVGHPVTLGSLGVPVFFVISGFIMVVITDGNARPGPFLRDRAARIVPLYWLATTAAAAWAVLAGTSSVGAWAVLIGGSDLKHLAASYLFLPWPIPGAEGHFYPTLGLGWTLNYEMFFYALFALSLLASPRIRLPLLTCLFLSFVLLGMCLQSELGAARFWTEPLILQFLCGAWLGRWWLRGRSFLWPVLGCVVATGLLALGRIPQFQTALWQGMWAVLTLLVVLALHRCGMLKRPIRPLLLLGDASYSIYLWHPLVLLALATTNPPGWVFVATGIALSIGAGILSYAVIERPLLRYFRLRRYRTGVVVPSL
jgi:exopolysaccharide production protein ExoZ